MGILGSFGFGDMPPVSGIIGGLNNGIYDNRSALIGMGLALMRGGGRAATMDALQAAMASGSEEDRKRRLNEQAAMLKQQEQARQVAMAKALGLPEIFAGSSVVDKVAANRYAPDTTGRVPSFEEREYNKLSDQDKEAYRRRRFLGEKDDEDKYLTPTIKQYEAEKRLYGEKRPFNEWKVDQDKPKPKELSVYDRKEIREADDAVVAARTLDKSLAEAQRLSPEAMSGPYASQRASGGAFLSPIIGGRGTTTKKLENIVLKNAVDALSSSIKGNPTEKEMEILRELQGSINQPDEIRQDIYRRAREAAQERIRINAENAAQLRGGTYYSPSGGSTSGATTPAPALNRAELEAEARRRGLIQ